MVPRGGSRSQADPKDPGSNWWIHEEWNEAHRPEKRRIPIERETSN